VPLVPAGVAARPGGPVVAFMVVSFCRSRGGGGVASPPSRAGLVLAV